MKTNFIKRDRTPSKENKWYISTKHEGFNKAMIINKSTGYVLPNCTGLVHGRWLECTGTNDPMKDNLCLGNPTSYWLKKDGYERGKKPKVGAVMVWSTHVAFVEEVIDDRTVMVSTSSYNGVEYDYRKLKYPFNWGRAKLKGFIYNPYITYQPELKVGDMVRIIGKGNSRADGTGSSAGGIGYIRYIFKIYPDEVYPYRVGLMDGRTTGYYQESALSLVKERKANDEN